MFRNLGLLQLCERVTHCGLSVFPLSLVESVSDCLDVHNNEIANVETLDALFRKHGHPHPCLSLVFAKLQTLK